MWDFVFHFYFFNFVIFTTAFVIRNFLNFFWIKVKRPLFLSFQFIQTFIQKIIKKYTFVHVFKYHYVYSMFVVLFSPWVSLFLRTRSIHFPFYVFFIVCFIRFFFLIICPVYSILHVEYY